MAPVHRTSGVTLLETLVATTILAVLASWTASGFLAVIALQGHAEARQVELDTLEGYLHGSLPALRELPECDPKNPSPAREAGPCLLREDACQVVEASLHCGSGPWRLLQLRAGREATAATLTLLRWAGP